MIHIEEDELKLIHLGDEEEGEDEKEQKAPKTPAVAMDLLKKERTVIISEEVSPKLTQRVMSSLLWLDSQSDDPIKLYINTPGGSADDGFAIFDLIRFVKAPVYNISFGLNASAGTIILLGAPKERRLALPNARIMIHQPSGGSRGRSSDIEITAEEILKLRHRANEVFAEECGRTVKQVEKDTDRDYWMSPEEAIEYGLVGRIITNLDDVIK
ncbi:MAG: ATP-dependent Clp protease proteolytic subunit [Planctomycetota bacterium]|nr:ATP-dependent Clp protease proteolytic subunit [Planctomycetota bacterium]|tara:strand:+ start:120 stop:758 length:639 start_codon:yes stop_codon:yes gene_type:complete